MKKPKAPLPPGEYTCKIVAAEVGADPKSGGERLTLTLSVPALGGRKFKVPAASMKATGIAPIAELDREDIERLAQTAWENTGKGELPVLPPGHGWVDQATGKVVDPKDLITTWEKVGTKDIFRRQAAAVAQALGFKLADDVLIRPRYQVMSSGDDFSIERFISRDLAPVEVRRIGDARRALALPEPKTKGEAREQIGILQDAVGALQSLDDLGVEANRRASIAMDKIVEKLGRLEKRFPDA